MIQKISILGGRDKAGQAEAIDRLEIRAGEVLAVVGPTGSGKTQLISDIEQYAEGESPTRRGILINDIPADAPEVQGFARYMVAEVSQKMNFVMDATVGDFLLRHARIRGLQAPEQSVREVLATTNTLAGEPVSAENNLTELSGGQARALMVGDVALISNAPVVLIDEIENAGIDRLKALEILAGRGKIVLVVTHDLCLMLLAERRVVMHNGGMTRLYSVTPEEQRIAAHLAAVEQDIARMRNDVRSGKQLIALDENKENNPPWKVYCSTAP